MGNDTQLSVAVGVAVATCLGWLVSTAVAVVKGKDWLEDIALRVLKSAEGRSAVLAITSDQNNHLDQRLDQLTRAVDLLGARLEGRMEQMSQKMDTRLERLDTDARGLDKRLFVIEDKVSHKE